MKSLDEAIVDVESQLRFIPTAVLRQMRILALINERTNSLCTCLHVHDELNRFVGGLLWPVTPTRLLKMVQVSPAFMALIPCSDLHEHFWDSPTGCAFVLPDSIYLKSLSYKYAYGPLNCRHAIVFGYPQRGDGTQVVVFPTRGHEGAPYKTSDLQTAEKICGHFADELSAVAKGGAYMPTHIASADYTTKVDAQLRPAGLSLYQRALLELFYGLPRYDSDGRTLLPATLEDDIRRYRDEWLGAMPLPEDCFFHTFTQPHRGRVLCLTVESCPDGTYRLNLHEDQSQFERLRRVMAACRALPRDRNAVFSACLVLAEGVRAHEEIIRRARLAAHKPSSALRIVNRARSILAAL